MFLVYNSENKKIGNVAATYLPIKNTCPDTCALKGKGCYAELGNVGFQVRRLERLHENKRAYDLVRKEAREIIAHAPTSNKPLRLHVSGDARTARSANLLAKAAKVWNGEVYTYTHAWRNIPRRAWGKISVLASCESIVDAKAALKRGYAPSIIVESHKSAKAYVKDGVKIIPCPSQTLDITCEKCKLCMKDNVLKKQNAVIAFAAHGVKKKVALRVIS